MPWNPRPYPESGQPRHEFEEWCVTEGTLAAWSTGRPGVIIQSQAGQEYQVIEYEEEGPANVLALRWLGFLLLMAMPDEALPQAVQQLKETGEYALETRALMHRTALPAAPTLRCGQLTGKRVRPDLLIEE